MKRNSRSPRRTVAVVTGTRAEFGVLESVLRAMRSSRRLNSRLIVTGMHLLPQFGKTIDHIRDAGWRVDATVPMQSGGDDPSAEALAVGRGVTGIARALDRLRAQVVVVLGDRIEALAGAVAACAGRRVLAHIHGGDRATGDVDDILRNAITRMAHVHLAASQDAVKRLKRMGEPPDRIHLVGAPGLDDIRRLLSRMRAGPRSAERRVRQLLGPLAGAPYALVVQHPCGRGPQQEKAIMDAITKAVEGCGLNGVAIYPNSDPGHSGIVEVINALRSNPRWMSFRSLPREDYLRLASGAALMVGNSSSGVIESASLGINAVNIGRRQFGRLRCGTNVLDAGESPAAILAAVRKALRMAKPRPERSVYGDGKAGRRVARILESLIISPFLLRKNLTF